MAGQKTMAGQKLIDMKIIGGTILVCGLMLLLSFSVQYNIQEWETFNCDKGYSGIYVTLDVPMRKIFEKIKLHEIELPNKKLILFNTFDY